MPTEKTVTTSQLCRIAGINPGTFHVWQKRWRDAGVEVFPDTGDGWSRFTVSDVIRATVVSRLAEFGVSPPDGAEHVRYLRGFKDDSAYLVIFTGRALELIPSTPRGTPATKKGQGRKVYIPGRLYPDLVRGADLPKFFADPDHHAAIVINLDNIEKHVKANWPKASE